MSDLALFTERQSFRQWWLWVILAGVNGLFLYALVVQVGLGRPVGDRPASDTGLLAMFGLMALLTWFLASLRLETRITDEAVMFRFHPLQRQWRVHAWKDIRSASIRTYSPLREYGGWGIRLGLGGRGTAYNVSGDQGMQLVLNNGKKILLGTARPNELQAVLQKLQPREGRG